MRTLQNDTLSSPIIERDRRVQRLVARIAHNVHCTGHTADHTCDVSLIGVGRNIKIA